MTSIQRRYPLRFNATANKLFFYSQADKDAELARLDAMIARHRSNTLSRSSYWARLCKARRRKVSGWVVGA